MILINGNRMHHVGIKLTIMFSPTVFCFGYLIHTGLNLGQKILYLTEEDPAFDDCTCTTDVVMSVLQPVYAFYQLFFIFKYSNVSKTIQINCLSEKNIPDYV